MNLGFIILTGKTSGAEIEVAYSNIETMSDHREGGTFVRFQSNTEIAVKESRSEIKAMIRAVREG